MAIDAAARAVAAAADDADTPEPSPYPSEQPPTFDPPLLDSPPRRVISDIDKATIHPATSPPISPYLLRSH